MALVRGDSGGVPASPVTPSIGIGGSFSIAAWRDQQEDEWGRQAAAARAAEMKRSADERQRMFQQRKADALPTANINAPSTAFKQRAQQAKVAIGAQFGGQSYGISQPNPEEVRKDPLFQYHRLSRSMGRDKLDERMATITDMVKTRLPYGDNNLVWELTRSPYALDEIGLMVDGAAEAMSKSGTGRFSREIDLQNYTVDVLQNKYKAQPDVIAALQDVWDARGRSDIPTDPVTGSLMIGGVIATTLT